MKVGLIGDVHANLPALEAVLEACLREEVEAIWNTGDFVGYNAFPNEVVERLRHSNVISVVGNYDLKVLKFPRRDRKWRRTKHPQKWFSFKWTYENLSKTNRDYLSSLPKKLMFTMEGTRIFLTHGSPASIREHLYSDTPTGRLLELSRIARCGLVICGHSHEAFARQVGDTWFVNTGSVGRSDDGDPRASFSLLSLGNGQPKVQHRRVPYDIHAAAEAIKARGLPEDFAEMVRQGRKLDWVLSYTPSAGK